MVKRGQKELHVQYFPFLTAVTMNSVILGNCLTARAKWLHYTFLAICFISSMMLFSVASTKYVSQTNEAQYPDISDFSIDRDTSHQLQYHRKKGKYVLIAYRLDPV